MAPARLASWTLLAVAGCAGTSTNPPQPSAEDRDGGSPVADASAADTSLGAGDATDVVLSEASVEGSVLVGVSDEAAPGCVAVGCNAQGITCATNRDH